MKFWQWRLIAHVLYRVIAHLNKGKEQDWLERALYWHCISLAHGDPDIEFDWAKIDAVRKDGL